MGASGTKATRRPSCDQAIGTSLVPRERYNCEPFGHAARHVVDSRIGMKERSRVGFQAIIPVRRDGRVVDGGGLENVSGSVIPRRLYFPPNFTPTYAKCGQICAIMPIFETSAIIDRPNLSRNLLI
jgi:hypothetical protein